MLRMQPRQLRKRHGLSRKRLTFAVVACLKTKIKQTRLPTTELLSRRTSAWPRKRETAKPPGAQIKNPQTKLRLL